MRLKFLSATSLTGELRFNTAISQLMVFVNEMSKAEVRPRAVLEPFVLLMGAYAPHWAEEVWHRLGNEESISAAQWPTADPQYLVEDTVTIVVQVMGKVRDQIEVEAGAAKDDILAQATSTEKIKQWTEGKQIVKQIYVPGKLVNLVVK